MGTTSNFNLPYPEPSNIPDGPNQIRALAEAVDNLLIPTDAPVEFGSHVEVVGNLGVQGDTYVEDLDAASITTSGLSVSGAVTVGSQNWNGEWLDFNANWTTSSGASPDIGNGTLIARYIQVGKTVHFTIVLEAGSTTSFGDGGYWQFNLPVQARYGFTATAAFRHSSPAQYVTGSCDCRSSSGGINAIIRINTPSGIAVRNSEPFTWGSGDTMKISGTYEAV